MLMLHALDDVFILIGSHWPFSSVKDNGSDLMVFQRKAQNLNQSFVKQGKPKVVQKNSVVNGSRKESLLCRMSGLSYNCLHSFVSNVPLTI